VFEGRPGGNGWLACAGGRSRYTGKILEGSIVAMFAVATTAYALFGIFLDERDSVTLLGEPYARYRTEVPMILPGSQTHTLSG
jgi:protein-S-isoprenylcysteine O-methyltransferase Ste14